MSKGRSPSIVSAGYSPLDVVLHRSVIRHSAGGSAGNVAAILAFLGWNSKIIGVIGDDPTAAALRSDFQRAGVATEFLVEASGSTTRVVHETGINGHAFHFSCPVCGVRFPRNRKLPVGLAEKVGEQPVPPAVYYFDRANAGTVRLAELFGERGATIVFEPSSSVDLPLNRRAVELADILKFSLAEDVADPSVLGVGRKKQVQIVTSGRAGASYRVGTSRWRRSPGFSYPTVDEAGAGDWVTACFLHALSLRDGNLNQVGEALLWAQAIAAVSCGSVGARGLAHVRSRKSVLESARRLRSSSATGSLRRRRPSDELGLHRASAVGACVTCLEPTTETVPESSVHWEVGEITCMESN